MSGYQRSNTHVDKNDLPTKMNLSAMGLQRKNSTNLSGRSSNVKAYAASTMNTVSGRSL